MKVENIKYMTVKDLKAELEKYDENFEIILEVSYEAGCGDLRTLSAKLEYDAVNSDLLHPNTIFVSGYAEN